VIVVYFIVILIKMIIVLIVGKTQIVKNEQKIPKIT